MAKMDASTELGGFVAELISVLKIPAFRHLALYRMCEAALLTLIVGGALYYFKYVEQLNRSDLSEGIMWLGLIAAIATIIALPLWDRFYKLPDADINRTNSAVMFCGCFAPALLFGVNNVFRAPYGFLFVLGLMQLTNTGQTFWRMNALGWVVDEDCLALVGRRREALFAGAVSFISSIGRGVAYSFIMIGLAAAGLTTKNCDVECADTTDAPTCVADCQVDLLASQPESVRLFIQALYCVCIPVLQGTCALLCRTFPIDRTRVARINEGMLKLHAANARPSPHGGGREVKASEHQPRQWSL
jgi:Na+/melibiose symporter-like transporter